MTELAQHSVVILDFGSQYTQLIARRVREQNVYSHILPWDAPVKQIQDLQPKGIILSGGPESVLSKDAPALDLALLDLNVPVLGICYGMQTLMHQLGGDVEKADVHEYGHAMIEIAQPNILFEAIDFEQADAPSLNVWMSHGDRINRLAPGFKCVAQSENAIAGVFNEERNIYGLQFHPEVTHTNQGEKIVKNFVINVCGCRPSWTPEAIIEQQLERVKAQVGDKRVVLGLSGGVDSSVVAALLSRVLGDKLTCIFVDTGLLRYKEAEEVLAMTQSLNIEVRLVEAQEQFLSALAGVECPEQKRKIIGNTFIEIFEQEALKIEDAQFLAQGTIYPDVIESNGASTAKAKVIKSHHNVGGLPEDMRLSLVEPLRELFKDEVRKVGLALGLKPELVHRHPFPGPGLGVRILGEVKEAFVDILQRADNIFIQNLREAGLYQKVAQAFAVFLPVKSVGVTGDARRYAYVIALRAVETTDFMTANCAQLPFSLLEKVSREIINQIPEVSRVTYDISSKPPATIEWE